uniref:Amiloride-sensitive cation channel 5 n=1 Tax=Enterobius vermicularis TaxID=51028 RepID=A0A0N4V0G0_ENTVE
LSVLSAHGIPRACVSHGVKRILWSLVLFSCIVAFLFQAKEIIERFFRYDVIVGVEVKFEKIQFPAVTVCNLNPYKHSLVQRFSKLPIYSKEAVR